MSEHYFITGVQLGLMRVGSEATRKSLLQTITEQQFIGNYYTEKEQQDFKKQMQKLKSRDSK